ncbi:hypothetical protein RSOLAG1IB_08592 [Rhizoctonia solani AG-1 IB]|uniref:Uncharacterized protein n=1 Tax=Thanatephorus cucumeris (strain AG1-IB / isolate 7/3/14) TaxID=1108050 RepID=A0A0B7FKK2_THACB|nr:hypothetical protein RSOLAG1IB_08592 [Rhizoctonia solani AG-1 IB]
MRTGSIIITLAVAYNAYAQAISSLASTTYRSELSVNASSTYRPHSSSGVSTVHPTGSVVAPTTIIQSSQPSVVAIAIECPWASNGVPTYPIPSATPQPTNLPGFVGNISTTYVPGPSGTLTVSVYSTYRHRPTGSLSYIAPNATTSHVFTTTVCISFSTIGVPGSVYTTYRPGPSGSVSSKYAPGLSYSGNVSTTYRAGPNHGSATSPTYGTTSYTTYIPSPTVTISATPAVTISVAA